MKQKGALVLVIATVCAIQLKAATTRAPLPLAKALSIKTLNGNAWEIRTSNFGPFVNANYGPGGFWPNGSGHSYIYGAGLWIGATDASNNRIVVVGYDTRSGGHEFGPEPWEDYLTNPLARVFISSDPVDFEEWPLIQDSKKLIRSFQDSYCKYSDLNPFFIYQNEKQLKVQVEQFSYAWNYADNNDIVFFYFKIRNRSGHTLRNVYLGMAVDSDIGSPFDDFVALDYQRNLAVQFQNEPEPGWDNTGAVGFRFLESPINNTGSTVTVIDNRFSHYILPDFPLGLTAFKAFITEHEFATDDERYLGLMGIDFWNMIGDAYDELTDTIGDKRFLMSSGPFNLEPDGMVGTCLGIIGGSDTLAVKQASDIAQIIYDNDFALANTPAAPTVTVTPGDKYMLISWDRKAETTPDPYWQGMSDSMGWYTYFPGSWEWLKPSGRQKVDSFKIMTGDSTSVKIAQGDPNPPGGTDTLMARYNQRSLYVQYDFQGYCIYRARHAADLADPSKREPLGGLYIDAVLGPVDSLLSFGGAQSYCYDKVDGIKIVRDLASVIYYYPDTARLLPVFDTLGTDRGLIYSLRDDNVINGSGWYYGVAAYDYQPNVYFTHKCPTTLTSNPTENATYGVAKKPMAGFKDPTINYLVTGSTAGMSSAINYDHKLTLIPKFVNDDTFRLIWKATTKHNIGGMDGVNYPEYHAELHDMQATGDTLLHAINYRPDYSIIGSDNKATFNGTLDDEIPFGGVVFNADYKFDWTQAKVDTVSVTGNYPEDSIFAQAYGPLNINFTASTNAWMWRGSDFEIRWRDSTGQVGTNPFGSILCATVWDITNNVEVPLEAGLTKINMAKTSWCFNPTATAGLAYLDSLSDACFGMFISGVVLYFNRCNGGPLKTMVWDQRPDSGDVWTVKCSGPGNPAEGGMVTFITNKISQQVGLSASLLDKVKVLPNPYLVRANWNTSKNYHSLYFVNLPAKCTIRIYNLAGDLVRVLNHESSLIDNNGTEKWDLLTSYDIRPASGVYLYQIDAPGIGLKFGKFAVIK
jgi:hypothetical protein